MPLRAASGRLCSTEHQRYDKPSILCSQVSHRLPGEITLARTYLEYKIDIGQVLYEENTGRAKKGREGKGKGGEGKDKKRWEEMR